MAPKDAVAKNWSDDLTLGWDGRLYSDPANVPDEPGGALYTETWEDKTLDASPEGVSWGAPSNGQWGNGKGCLFASVQDEYAYAESRSCRIAYQAKPVYDGNDTAGQLAFDIGFSLPAVTIRYRWRIPDNYIHRATGFSDNNKILRLWQDDGVGGATSYDWPGKVGASMRRENDTRSNLSGEWNSNGDGIGDKGTPYSGFIVPADFGQWLEIEVYAQYATPGNADGILLIKKNGVTAVNLTNVANNYGTGTKEFRYGYLMGACNTGYAEETRFFIDNVEFFEGPL